jgi:Spy/CpxP family protein refolding chaperone
MMTNQKLLAVLLATGGAVVAAGASFSIASAQETTANASEATGAPTAEHWHRGHGGMMHLYGKLGLTAEQQASIKAILVAAKPSMKSLRQQMRANHQKMESVTPDDANYSTVVSEVATANATLASQRTTQASQVNAQIYAVLTPAQKTQLAALKAQWAAKAAAWKAAHAVS